MKRLSIYLFLILFTLPTPSQADDIRDLQIEGMSIGDSALDYFSEKKINSLQERFYPKSRKFFYVVIGSEKKFKIYDKVILNFKANDKNYKIYALSGGLEYLYSIEECYKQRKEIISELDSMFHNAKKKNYTYKYSKDSGKATVKHYYLKDGDVRIWCTDWSTWTDNLQVQIRSKEYAYWFKNEAR